MEINVLIQCCAFISPVIPLLSWSNEMGGYHAANKPCIENLSRVIICYYMLVLLTLSIRQFGLYTYCIFHQMQPLWAWEVAFKNINLSLTNLKLLNHTVKIANPAFTSLNEWIENTGRSPTPLLLCKSHELNVRAFPPNNILGIFVAMCFAILKTWRIGVLTQIKCF